MEASLSALFHGRRATQHGDSVVEIAKSCPVFGEIAFETRTPWLNIGALAIRIRALGPTNYTNYTILIVRKPPQNNID